MMHSAQRMNEHRFHAPHGHSAFIMILAVIVHLEDDVKLSQQRHQLATLYLSESLTVLNSYRR